MKQHVDLRILGERNYQLLADIYFETDKYCIFVNKGFRWNGADIPRILWEEFGCPLDFAFESCIHDALYGSHLLARRECDEIFKLALLAQGVGEVKAHTMYMGVVVGGEDKYNESMGNVAYHRDYVIVITKHDKIHKIDSETDNG